MGDSDSLPVRPSFTNTTNTNNSHNHLGAPSRTNSTSDDLPTPSLLTPNTRAEAEFAFSSNAVQQTDSAAPSTAPPIDTDSPAVSAPKGTRRPLAPPRSGSSNYIAALAKVPAGYDPAQFQVYSPMTEGAAQVDGTGERVVDGEGGKELSYSRQDAKRVGQAHVVGKRDGAGYDSVQEQEGV